MVLYTKPLKNCGINDIAEVWGKNASLGEMMANLGSSGIRVPNGFSVTVNANISQIATGSTQNSKQ